MLPCAEFYRAFIKKALSLIVSLKVYIINVTFVLLYLGKLTSEDAGKIIMTIAIGKVGVDTLSVWRGHKRKEPEIENDIK